MTTLERLVAYIPEHLHAEILSHLDGRVVHDVIGWEVPADLAAELPGWPECECTCCGCDEPATQTDAGGVPVCDACSEYTTDDDGDVVCSRESTCSECGVDRLVPLDHGTGLQRCDCEEAEARADEDRDPDGEWAVVDMDGDTLSRHSTEAGAHAAVEHEMDRLNLLRRGSRGAYRDCYWPRSVVHVPCGSRRAGQWSTAWYSPGCDHHEVPR